MQAIHPSMDGYACGETASAMEMDGRVSAEQCAGGEGSETD